ncbi:MAG: CRISPR-associated endonuclease Cas1 [Desulfurococcaceae archaeon]
MRTLVVSGYGVGLSVKKGTIVLKTKNEVKNVSLSDVDSIVVTTSGVSITSKAVRQLTKMGVMLVFLDSRGMPVAVLHHPFTTRTVETRRAQYEAVHNGKACEVAKAVVTSKLLNQAGLLAKLARDTKLETLVEAKQEVSEIASKISKLKSKDLRELRAELLSIEAEAARHYWTALAEVLPKELKFEGRDQEGCDTVNCALNYCYGILYPVIWKSTSIHGLDPYAGFLHVDRSGKPVLTFDLIEVFRVPAVDFPLVRSLRSGLKLEVENCLLNRESRTKLVSLVVKAMGDKYSAYGETRSLESWVNYFVSSIAAYLRSETPLRPLVFRW